MLILQIISTIKEYIKNPNKNKAWWPLQAD